MDAQQQFKQAAAESAVTLVEDGMILGLGTGSTAKLAVDALGKRVAGGLRVTGIPTSEGTRRGGGCGGGGGGGGRGETEIPDVGGHCRAGAIARHFRFNPG